jgi:hypothetical protein
MVQQKRHAGHHVMPRVPVGCGHGGEGEPAERGAIAMGRWEARSVRSLEMGNFHYQN